jgi:hypothetical protein
VIAPLLSTKAPNRVIIIGGQFLIAVLITLVGVFTSTKQDFWLLLCMYGYLFIYQLTIGNIFWIYVAEVACEKGVALASGVYWLLFLVSSFFT